MNFDIVFFFLLFFFHSERGSFFRTFKFISIGLPLISIDKIISSRFIIILHKISAQSVDAHVLQAIPTSFRFPCIFQMVRTFLDFCGTLVFCSI